MELHRYIIGKKLESSRLVEQRNEMKRLLLCVLGLCLVISLNSLAIQGCGGVNSSGGGGVLLEGFYYILGTGVGQFFTYSAYEIEPTSGTLSLLGTGERQIPALSGWTAGTSFMGDIVNPTSDGYLLTTIIDSGAGGTAKSFSVDFNAGPNAGVLTERSSQTLLLANMYGYYMRYDGGSFVICHDSAPNAGAPPPPLTDDIAYLSYSNGILGAPNYSPILAGFQYYGGSVVLKGRVAYMVVINGAGDVHILAYRFDTAGNMTLVRDIDLSGTINGFADEAQLVAYANVRNNQYATLIYDLNGPQNYFFVVCNLDGSGTPTLAGIHDFGTFSNGFGPGKPIFANGYWFVVNPSLPSNNHDRISGFRAGTNSLTILPGSPMVFDPVETNNTQGFGFMGFRDQIYYGSNEGGHKSLHSRVVAADGTVSDPSVAENTAFHNFNPSFNFFRLIRQGRMIVGLTTSGPPHEINLIRATLTDGKMERYDNPAAPVGQSIASRNVIILK